MEQFLNNYKEQRKRDLFNLAKILKKIKLNDIYFSQTDNWIMINGIVYNGFSKDECLKIKKGLM